nr:MAG TPA: hypothetical protein [Caudoviricetes sp.]
MHERVRLLRQKAPEQNRHLFTVRKRRMHFSFAGAQPDLIDFVFFADGLNQSLTRDNSAAFGVRNRRAGGSDGFGKFGLRKPLILSDFYKTIDDSNRVSPPHANNYNTAQAQCQEFF